MNSLKSEVSLQETKQQLSSSHSYACTKEKPFIWVLHYSSKLSKRFRGFTISHNSRDGWIVTKIWDLEGYQLEAIFRY